MRKVLIVLLLLAAAMAVEIDPETGCEKHPGHVVCPQASDVEIEIRYTTDAECYVLINDFGNLEPAGCYALAETTEDLEYGSCSMYVPFDEMDVLVEGMDYEYQCVTEKVRAGTELIVIGMNDHYEDCRLLDEDWFGSYWECPIQGKERVVFGGISYGEEGYSILAYSQKERGFPGAGLATPIMAFLVLVLLVYAAYVWTERKK